MTPNSDLYDKQVADALEHAELDKLIQAQRRALQAQEDSVAVLKAAQREINRMIQAVNELREHLMKK
jgi:aromatic ring-opening dioxygenase LigB subunit